MTGTQHIACADLVAQNRFVPLVGTEWCKRVWSAPEGLASVIPIALVVKAVAMRTPRLASSRSRPLL